MPPGAPLSPAQIETVRRWIAEGAVDDRQPTLKQRVSLRAKPGRTMDIAVRVPVESLVTLTIGNPVSRETLHVEEAVVRERADATAHVTVNEWMRWNLSRGLTWPREVTIDMEVTHAKGEATGAVLQVDSILSAVLQK